MENCGTGKGYLANIARVGFLHLELMWSAEFCRLIPVLETCGSAVELALFRPAQAAEDTVLIREMMV